MIIKNIVFDVGGVLLKNGTRQFVQEFITHKEDIDVIDRELFHSVERVQLDRGIISKEVAFSQMLSRVPIRSREEAMQAYDKYMSNRKVVNGMVELLQKLKKQGHNLYVLSNFSTDFWDVIKQNRLDFFDLFEGVFVSSFYQVVKPEKEIYERFLAKYNLEAESCLFVDDKAENVEAAKQRGFDGFHFGGNVVELEEYINTITETV